MSKINIQGETYKVRERMVNGEKKEIYYKDGNAFIKDSSGNLTELHKVKDSLFTKAEYETQEYKSLKEEQFADRLNSKYDKNNRPTLQGEMYSSTLLYDLSYTGSSGSFRDANGDVIKGYLEYDKDSKQNRIISESNSSNGVSSKATYTIDEQGNFFMLKRIITAPNGKTIERTYDETSGKYLTSVKNNQL